MATFIQTNELASGTKVPSSAAGIVTDGWGIDASLSGFIIQNASVSHSRITDVTQDLKGAEIGELDYDESWQLTLDVIGNPSTIASAEDGDIGIAVGDTAFSFNGKTWKVDSVTYNGTYNDKKKWQIVAHRTKLFPTTNS